MRKQLRAEMGGQAKEDGEAPVQQPADVKERIDLVQVFREECEQFVAPKGKSIRLSFFPFADTLPVIGSRLQMREMIEILLANSANFSPSGSKVKVFAEQQGDKAVIRVADNGVGIPTEVMPHLFEQIVGDDDSPNLHAVFDIVMSHGGTIRADENNGGGTVFVIELPLCKGDGDVEEAEMI
jgi:signal transduction histidine kinase